MGATSKAAVIRGATGAPAQAGAGPEQPWDPFPSRDCKGRGAASSTAGNIWAPKNCSSYARAGALSVTLPRPVCALGSGTRVKAGPNRISEGHSALRFGLWVEWEERSLGGGGGSMGQQTHRSLHFREGLGSCRVGSLWYRPLSQAKDHSPLKLPSLSPFLLGTLPPRHRSAMEGKPQCGLIFHFWLPLPASLNMIIGSCRGQGGSSASPPASSVPCCCRVRPLGPGLGRESDLGNTLIRKGGRFWNPDNNSFIVGICRSLCIPPNPLKHLSNPQLANGGRN